MNAKEPVVTFDSTPSWIAWCVQYPGGPWIAYGSWKPGEVTMKPVIQESDTQEPILSHYVMTAARLKGFCVITAKTELEALSRLLALFASERTREAVLQ